MFDSEDVLEFDVELIFKVEIPLISKALNFWDQWYFNFQGQIQFLSGIMFYCYFFPSLLLVQLLMMT